MFVGASPENIIQQGWVRVCVRACACMCEGYHWGLVVFGVPGAIK